MIECARLVNVAPAAEFRAQVAADHVAPERQRQPTRAVGPPFAQIHDLAQPLVRVGELSFVDQQTGVDAPFAQGAGRTKKEAEQEGAKLALAAMEARHV